jgi:methylated-DNA-[protein]-cysteine S-methyltransferase
LRELRFADHGEAPPAGADDTELPDVKRALERYFAGDLGALSALTTAAEGTDYQRRVWRRLRDIPAGQTRSYEQIARALGDTSARAVGAANGRNPVALVVPCHRVIGSDGALTGYAGGLERKRWLLEHEGALTPRLL